MNTKELINIYNQIQNVEYRIAHIINYSVDNSYDLVNSNVASCAPKHIILSEKFKENGLITRFCLHKFNWSDLNFIFPHKLSELSKKYSSDYHTNLEVKIDNRWVMVDATWDNELINSGFPATQYWNGKDSTLNAVASKEVYKFNSLKERNDFLKTETKNKTTFSEEESIFINELNSFFQAMRVKNN